MKPQLDIALVVPVHEDAAALERLLEQVAGWSAAPAEIIVAASRADAALERLCRAHGARLLERPRNRGAQLDAGARAARAAALWFVHAHAEPPADGLETIAARLAAGIESGCFEFRFQGDRRWHKMLLERLVALRVRCGGIPYGDQALFATREAYAACGGFAHEPLFEESGLVRRLRNRGTFEIVESPVHVSTRRFERDGWLRRALANRWLAARHLLGTPAQALAREYRAGRSAHARRDESREQLQDKEV